MSKGMLVKGGLRCEVGEIELWGERFWDFLTRGRGALRKVYREGAEGAELHAKKRQ
jgi:hypothetical protein